ncbi:hypothetical protein D9M72_158860 [compost metagenome]
MLGVIDMVLTNRLETNLWKLVNLRQPLFRAGGVRLVINHHCTLIEESQIVVSLTSLDKVN